MDVSIPCGECTKPVRVGDDFCQNCGHRVTAREKGALAARLDAAGLPIPTSYRVAADASGEALHPGRRLGGARSAVLLLAVLFAIAGVVQFFLARSTASDALHNLRYLDAASLYPEPVNGVTYTVRELRAMVEREPYQILGVNLLLATLMAGLFVWSKRAPLPATLTALAIYVAVLVGNAIVDPVTLVQGVIVKIVALVLLVRGVREALAGRAAEQARAA